MEEYGLAEEDKIRQQKELAKMLKMQQPRNRAERRALIKENKKKR